MAVRLMQIQMGLPQLRRLEPLHKGWSRVVRYLALRHLQARRARAMLHSPECLALGLHLEHPLPPPPPPPFFLSSSFPSFSFKVEPSSLQ